jgi:hypothetical protein
VAQASHVEDGNVERAAAHVEDQHADRLGGSAALPALGQPRNAGSDGFVDETGEIDQEPGPVADLEQPAALAAIPHRRTAQAQVAEIETARDGAAGHLPQEFGHGIVGDEVAEPVGGLDPHHVALIGDAPLDRPHDLLVGHVVGVLAHDEFVVEADHRGKPRAQLSDGDSAIPAGHK